MKEKTLYKHSLGHYWTKEEAEFAKKEYKDKYSLDLEVIQERRRKSKWKSWCVCEFFPEQNSKSTQTTRKKGKKTRKEIREKSN